jgi:L-seryl-tRNA(Ser) seleniumtransferase
MLVGMSIFEQWNVRPIINASGSVTRLGGAPMPQQVLQAFADAAAESVPLDELQAAASRVIARATGAEAGLVTAGAAAGLTLGAAAILCKNDIGRMERLPFTDSFPNEFIVAREQRNGYDHAVRAAGARLVEVGFNEIIAGAGVRRTEVWEYESAVHDKTVGILYVLDRYAQPPLVEIVRMAHHHGLKVLVDAAGELPPRSNLREIVASGADLVAFSGGKAIRGPQASGILCGRNDLIASAAVQFLDMDDHYELWEPPQDFIAKARLGGIPRHGIGRSMKVSKEQIAALLTALRLFEEGAYDGRVAEASLQLERVVAALASYPVTCNLIASGDGQTLPLLEITLQSGLNRSALEFCRALRLGDPPVYVGHGLLHKQTLTINPMHLNVERTTTLIRRIVEELKQP